MTSLLLNLDSSNVTTTRTHDFTVRFPTGIDLQGEWEVSLVSSNLWYSFTNVDDTTNKIAYSPDSGVTWKTLILAVGNYNIVDINDALTAFQVANGDDVAGVAQVTIVPNYNTSRVEINIVNPTFQVDLSVSNMYVLFGFSPAQAASPLTVTTTSDNIADITNGRSKILICSSLLENSYSMWNNGEKGTVLYSFSPDAPPGSLMQIQPSERVYMNIIPNRRIDSIRMYLLDNQGRAVDMRGEVCTYMVHLRKVVR